MELKTIKETVKEILRDNEKTRGDDDLLYLEVLKAFMPYYNDNVITTNIQNITLEEFFTHRRRKGLPSFESIRRVRQKIQEINDELRPAENIQNGRFKQEEKFYNFAKE